MQVRLDKFLSGLGLLPRRQAGKAVSQGHIFIDGVGAVAADQKLKEGQIIHYIGQDIVVREYVYVLLHKPAGYVCSERDEAGHMSYKELLQDCPYAPLLHIAGRLDHDTEGLVLCSNDGQRTHTIISPKKHLEKEYYVRTAHRMTPDMFMHLESGIVFLPGYPGGGKDDGYTTMPARAFPVTKDGIACAYDHPDCEPYALRLLITEGKFHQVKRMLLAVGNEVTYLRRERIGKRTLNDVEYGKRKMIEK